MGAPGSQNLNFLLSVQATGLENVAKAREQIVALGTAGKTTFGRLTEDAQKAQLSFARASLAVSELANTLPVLAHRTQEQNIQWAQANLQMAAAAGNAARLTAESYRLATAQMRLAETTTAAYAHVGIPGGAYQAGMMQAGVEAQGFARAQHLANMPTPLPMLGQRLQEHGKEVAKLGTMTRQTGMNITMGLTLPLTLVGGAAMGAASQYETAMEQIRSQTGGTTQEVALMKGEMLKLAKSTEFTPLQLSQALFQVESVDIRGPRALEAMKAATMGATAGQADLTEVTRALAAALTSQVDGTKSAIQVMGLMNSIVAHGRLDMDQFAASMGTGILAAAKNFGISMNDLGAAMVVMTNAGVGAQESATRLRMTFSLLSSPSEKASGVLRNIGIDTLDIAHAIREGGLIDGLTLLKTKLDAFSADPAERARVISEAFGGGRSSTTLVTLLDQLDNVKKAHADIAAGAGDLQASYDNMLDTFGFKWRNFVANLQVQAIKLGEAFAPFAIAMMNTILPLIESLVTAITSMPGPLQKVAIALIAIAAVSGPVMVIAGAFISLYAVLGQVAGAVIVTAQAFRLLLGFYGSLRVASIALIGTFSTLQLSLFAITAVLLSIEAISRMTGGHGIVDMFTNDHEEAEIAARSLEKYGRQVERIQKMVAAGTNEQAAQEFIKDETVTQAIGNLMRLNAAFEDNQGKPKRQMWNVSRWLPGDWQKDTSELKANIKNSLDELENMGLSGNELKEIGLHLFPILEQPGNFEALKHFRQIMFDQLELEEAMREATHKAMVENGNFTESEWMAVEATKALTESMDAYAASLKAAQALLEAPDAQTEFLKTQIAAWERLRAELDLTGGSTTHADNMLAGLNARLTALDSSLSSSQQLLSFYAASMEELSVKPLESQGNLILLANTLRDMPTDLRIKLDLMLPDLEIHRLMALLDALAHANGSTIRIKLALEAAMMPAAAMAPSEAEWAFARGLGGEAGAQAEAALTRRQNAANIQAAFDYRNAMGSGADANTGARLNAGSSAADNMNKTEFGLIELGKAFEKFKEITHSESIPAFKAWLEAQKKLVDAQEEQAIRVEQATNPLLAMNMALLAIRTRIIETNGTIETFLRNDVFMPALNNFKSALGELFGEPPREVQELELRKAHLELQRLEMIRGGAKPKDLKGIDKQIEAIDADIAIISKRVDIYKKTAELMDQTIKTEQEILDASIILGQIIFNASNSVRMLDGAAAFNYLTLINLSNAWNEQAANFRSGAGAAAAINSAGAAAGTNVTINLNSSGLSKQQIRADVLKALDDAFVYDSFAGNSTRDL